MLQQMLENATGGSPHAAWPYRIKPVEMETEGRIN